MVSKIKNVRLYEDNPEELLIELVSGCDLLLTMKSKKNGQTGNREFSLPKTDGNRVYWHNGASITFGEIMDMLRE